MRWASEKQMYGMEKFLVTITYLSNLKNYVNDKNNV